MEPFQRLEHEWAKWSGYPPECVVVCSSGSTALHLALESLRLPLGSEIICPDFTMIACPRAISLAGHVPVFVDCGDDLLIDPSWIGPAITSRTRAIMPVHIYGRRCDMDAVISVAGRYGLLVVEDLAEAHGVPPHPRTDAACWSAYRNKIVAGQEGGVVAFRDPEHAALARSLRSLGFTGAHNYRHVPRGINARLASALAAPILESLARVEEILAARRQIEGWYGECCPGKWRMPPRDAPWVMDIRIPGLTHEVQTRIVRALNAVNIAARHAFRPMSTQEEYRNCRVISSGKAAIAAREVLYLPLMPGVVTKESTRLAFEVIYSALSGGHSD